MPPRLPTTLLGKNGALATQHCQCFALPLRSYVDHQIRHYATQMKTRDQARKAAARAKAKKHVKTQFTYFSLKDADQFALVDAMRYIRAFEVGRDPVGTKYDLALRIRTPKNGPTVKNKIRLPKPVKTDMRICVFAEGKAADQAKKAGAVVVGSTDLWEEIRNGRLDFDRCIAHSEIMNAFNKAKLGRILGPKGMMPSPKFGTVSQDVGKAVRDLVGASEYRERLGAIRMSVGQLGFTVDELTKNIKYFVEAVRSDLGRIDAAEKSIHEIVLSSTNSPGFSLTGEVKTVEREEKAEMAQVLKGESEKLEDVIEARERLGHIVTASDDIVVSTPAMAQF